MSKWQSGGGAESRPVSIANNNINLVKLGVLEKVQESKWGSPTFIIQKIQNGQDKLNFEIVFGDRIKF